MSHTSYEWTLLDFAAWEAGLVVVPVYETSSAEQARWILTDAGVRLIIVENEAMASMVGALTSTVPELESLQVLCIEREDVLGLIKAGRGVDAGELDRRSAALTSQSLATIVYTSGTTGRPKGVELSHGNLVHLCVNVCPHVPEVLGGAEVRFLLFLPLAHVLGRFVEIAVVCSRAGVLGHVPDVRNLLNDLGSFRPTAVLAVPRVFEKIYNAADAKATGAKQKVFRLAAKTAIAYSRALDTPQGYGLTETMGPCSVNLPQVTRIGTVGTPLPGCSLRLDDDGEILVRGIGTFTGYHNNPEATAEAFTDDGWLRTGDIGSFEGAEGFLRITGRKKELIVTAGGKNVAPAPLEDRLRGHPLVSQVLVVGENRPCIGALLTLDAELLPLWLSSHGLEEMTVVDAARDPRVRAALEKAVARANEAVSRAESIRTFEVLPTDFTVANGLLTPTLKVRRAEAEKRFSAEIEALYTRTPLIPGTTVSPSQD